MTYSPPRPYEFNEFDRDRFRYWACPVQIFQKFPDLAPSAVSALPPLAFLTFPERTKDEGANHKHLAPSSPDWTVWAAVSLRWLATLGGMNKDSAGKALESLCENNLAESGKIARPKHQGGFQTVIRLSRGVFAEQKQPMVQIPGSLVFSGTWMLLPTHSARCVYLAIACLSAVRNPEALAHALEDAGVPDFEEQIEERRANSPVSLALLEGATGYRRSTIVEALSILTEPIFGKGSKFGLVTQGKASNSQSNTYWINDKATKWHFTPENLNRNAKELQGVRDNLWPELSAQRHERAQVVKKRKIARRVKQARKAA